MGYQSASSIDAQKSLRKRASETLQMIGGITLLVVLWPATVPIIAADPATKRRVRGYNALGVLLVITTAFLILFMYPWWLSISCGLTYLLYGIGVYVIELRLLDTEAPDS
jgi:Ca2+/Na+ antiporter